MRLEVDIGNTRVKWRLYDNKQVSDTLAVAIVIDSESSFDEVFSAIDLSTVNAVYVSNVVPFYHDAFIAWCATRLSCKPVFAEVEKHCSGVTNGYHDVSQMGVDRWLALLAAYAKCQSACLVVDAGSAMTVDLLQSDGRHLGGYIVPGLQMMNNALFRSTGRVKLEAFSCDLELSAGGSTRQAVAAGLPLMLLGLIQRAYSELCLSDLQLGSAVELLLTGGDSEYIAALLSRENSIKAKRVPDLVLDGLQLSIGKEGLKK